MSQVLSAWIIDRSHAPFFALEATEAVRSRLESLPHGAFVDPELRVHPERLVHAALAGMRRLGMLSEQSGTLRMTARYKHPQFPDVDDMIAFQARFFSETEQALRKLDRPSVATDL